MRNGRLRIYEDNKFPFTVYEDNKSAFTVYENTPLAPSIILIDFFCSLISWFIEVLLPHMICP